MIKINHIVSSMSCWHNDGISKDNFRLDTFFNFLAIANILSLLLLHHRKSCESLRELEKQAS